MKITKREADTITEALEAAIRAEQWDAEEMESTDAEQGCNDNYNEIRAARGRIKRWQAMVAKIRAFV